LSEPVQFLMTCCSAVMCQMLTYLLSSILRLWYLYVATLLCRGWIQL